MIAMEAKNGSRSETVTSPERRTHLGDLIRARRAELGESLDTFAPKAVDPDSGVRVTRGYIYRLEKGEKVTPPVFEELKALAAAARLPLERLQDAAGSQFHGVDPLRGGSGEATAYVRKLDQLPSDQRDRLLRLIDTLVPPKSGDE